MSNSTINEIKPTEEQQEIMEVAGRRGQSVMVEAGAGCAKTTTLGLAGRRMRELALAMAFGKRNAEDLKKALPSNFNVKTANALGMMAWARALPGLTLKLDDRKLAKIITSVSRDHGIKRLDEDEYAAIRGMTRWAMMGGLVPEGDPEGEGSIIPDSEAGWWEIAQEAEVGKELFKNTWELSRAILIENIAQARQGIISFDDQIYCSSMLGGRFPKFPIVLVDEDQDLSALNLRMLELSVAPSGRIMAVGDKNQSIYAWRGAMGDAGERIKGLRPEWAERPLMTTFRCPKLVVERQLSHVPSFRAAEQNRLGTIFRMPRAEAEGPGGGWGAGDIMRYAADGRKVAILCRNNAPLLGLAIRLLRKGIGVTVLGRDIGKNLITLTRKLASDDGTPREVVLRAIQTWVDKELALDREGLSEGKIDSTLDKAEALKAVMAGAECRDARDLRNALTTIFAKENAQVELSTIHKAKGLEWDVVMHLDPWRLPSRRALEQDKAGQPLALQQERNMQYVCETRTRDVLLFGNLEDFR